MSWRINKNPVSLFTGGVAAVIFELAEPRVRCGVWHHGSFRMDPVGRARRTGATAMVTTYGARADVERVTERVRRMHEGIHGTTPQGAPYQANDPELLRWVFVTARWGLLQGYLHHVNPALSRSEQDRYYAEATTVAPFYGVTDPPTSADEVESYIREMQARLQWHQDIQEFLDLLSNTPVISTGALPLQRLLVRAGVDLLPRWAGKDFQLESRPRARYARRVAARAVASIASAVLRNGPPRQACLRMGLPAEHLAH